MMILACDDERIPLELLSASIREARPEARLFAFGDPMELLDFARQNQADVAFLDIQMYGMTGLELAKRLKDLIPEINIIFVTGYSQYAGDAMMLRASGYVMSQNRSALTECWPKLIGSRERKKRNETYCFGFSRGGSAGSVLTGLRHKKQLLKRGRQYHSIQAFRRHLNNCHGGHRGRHARPAVRKRPAFPPQVPAGTGTLPQKAAQEQRRQDVLRRCPRFFLRCPECRSNVSPPYLTQ